VFSLKDVFETVLLADLIAAVEKSVDERLWRHVFYTPIEELRSELRKVWTRTRISKERLSMTVFEFPSIMRLQQAL